MNLNSARQVWHDCGYNPFRSALANLEELTMGIGGSIQITDRGVTADHAAHSTLAGWFQSVIDKIHPQVRVFGDFMYAAERDEDIREAAEEVVYGLTLSKMPRMTAGKKAKAVFVAKGVMYRYQHMHQGGQSANPDPLAKPETFRAWLFDQCGVRIPSTNWERDWEAFVKKCFECCEDLDRMALSPVAGLIYEMKEVA